MVIIVQQNPLDLDDLEINMSSRLKSVAERVQGWAGASTLLISENLTFQLH